MNHMQCSICLGPATNFHIFPIQPRKRKHEYCKWFYAGQLKNKITEIYFTYLKLIMSIVYHHCWKRQLGVSMISLTGFQASCPFNTLPSHTFDKFNYCPLSFMSYFMPINYLITWFNITFVFKCGSQTLNN